MQNSDRIIQLRNPQIFNESTSRPDSIPAIFLLNSLGSIKIILQIMLRKRTKKGWYMIFSF